MPESIKMIILQNAVMESLNTLFQKTPALLEFHMFYVLEFTGHVIMMRNATPIQWPEYVFFLFIDMVCNGLCIPF